MNGTDMTRLQRALQLAAFAAVFSAALPLSAAAADLLCPSDAVRFSLIGWLLAEAAGLTAVKIGGIAKKRLRLPLTASVLLFAAGAFAAQYLLVGTGLLSAILSALLTAAAFLFGRLWHGRVHKIRDFLWLSLIYIACGVFLQYRGAGSLNRLLVVPLLLSGCCYAAYRNYFSIDMLMQRRGHSTADLPPKSRLLNLLLLAAAALLAILLVLGRPVLMPACGWVLKQFGMVFVYLIRFFDWIMLQILREPSGDLLEAMAGMAQEDGSAMEEETEEAAETAAHADLQIGFLIFVAAAVAVLAVVLIIRKNRRHLPRQKKRGALLRRMADRIRRILERGRMFRVFRPDDNESYTDTEEAIDADGQTVPMPAEPLALRAWRREVRALRKLPPDIERFRRSYDLITEGLRLHGIKLMPGDTPLEIQEKAAQLLTGPACDAVTACCNAMRYGPKDPVPENRAADLVLAQLRK